MTIHNPVGRRKLETLLHDLGQRKDLKSSIHRLDKPDASKKLLHIGGYILHLKHEISKEPIPGYALTQAYSYVPHELVVYRETPNGKGHFVVIKTIPEPDASGQFDQWQWKALSKLTESLKENKPIWDPSHLANGLARLIHFFACQDNWNLPKKAMKAAVKLDNQMHGVGQLRIYGEEREELAKSGEPLGFSVQNPESMTDYVEQVLTMLMTANTAMEQAARKYPNSEIKLGLWPCTPNHNQTIEDISELFPQCDMKRSQMPNEQARWNLEVLFNKKT